MLVCSILGYAQATRTYYHIGHLLDTERGTWMDQVTVSVQNGKILSVEKGFQSVPQGDVAYHDFKDLWVTPGLTDMHVHIETEYDSNAYLKRFTLNPEDLAFDAAVYSKRTLEAGFTSVRDLGGTGVNTAARDAINQGKIPGPRIFSAGKTIASTGGHGDPTNGHKKEFMGTPGPDQGVVNSPDEGRAAVRTAYKNGSDQIKITSTGGVLSVAKDGSGPQFTIEEIKAITSTASDYGMHVAAHAHGDEGMRRAVEGGVKTIEHGTFMSPATMKLMIKKEAYLVPTLRAGDEVADKAEIDGFYPEVIRPKAREVGPQLIETTAAAYKAGVPIVFGTDAGVFPHGENAKEFALMKQAGIPVMEALQMATIIPAKILRTEEVMGQSRPGFYADFVGLATNPENDVTTLERPVLVIKEGVIVKGN